MLIKQDADSQAIDDSNLQCRELGDDFSQFERTFVPNALSRRPKVSILLITYNHEKYIGQALESVLMQVTEYDFIINVIEDCSTDRTQEIVMQYVEKYPEIVKPYFNAKNIGRKVTQKNFFRGFQTMSGEYLAILEGDDYWSSPYKLQKQVEFLEVNPEYSICAGNTVKIYEDGSKDPHRFLYWGKQDDGTIEDVINLRIFFHTTGILYRNVFNGVPPKQYISKWSCDIFIMISHAEFGKVHHIDEDMAVYRAHGGGMFSNMPQLDAWMFNIDGLRRYNRWLNYRHCKAFAESIARYSKHVLTEAGTGDAAPLGWSLFIKLLAIRAIYGSIYLVLDAPQQIRNLAIRLVYEPSRLLQRSRTGLLSRIKRKFTLLYASQTSVADLPALRDGAEWGFMWGLNVRPVGGRQIATGQPILGLTAIAAKESDAADRHALAGSLKGLIPGSTYRVTLWVRAIAADANVHVQLRDSNVGETGKPAHECDVRFDLSSRSVKSRKGDVVNSGIERGSDGWLTVWLDFKTSDEQIFFYLGLINVINNHTFRGAGERLLFGGIEAELSPRRVDLPAEIRSRVIGKTPTFTEKLPPFTPRSLLFSPETALTDLPHLPDFAEWHFAWALNARVVEGTELIAKQPILDLTAVPIKGRHALCECLSGLEPGSSHRVTFWVRPITKNTNVHIQLRDSNIGDTGKPANECDVWYNFSTQSVRISSGDVAACGIEPEPDGWFKLWVDTATADGQIYACLGLVKRGMNKFMGGGERVLFGAIAVDISPGILADCDVPIAV